MKGFDLFIDGPELRARILRGTPEERAHIIDALPAKPNSWTNADFRLLGVPLPLAKGWRAKLIKDGRA